MREQARPQQAELWRSIVKALPDEVLKSVEAYVSCIAGATLKDEYIESIELVGFQDIEIMGETPLAFEYSPTVQVEDETKGKLVPVMVTDSVVSMKISAVKLK